MRKLITLFVILVLTASNLYSDDDGGSILGGLEKGQSGSSSSDSDNEILLILQFIEIAPELLIMFQNEDTLFYDGKLWDRGYTDYPYQDKNSGLYKIDNSGKNFLVNFNSQYLQTNQFVDGYGLNTEWHLINLFNINVNYILLEEKMFNSDPNRLHLYHVFLNYERVRSEYWTLHWGIGYMGMKGKRINSSFGVNLSMKVFPFNPISLEFDTKYAIFQSSQFSDNSFSLNVHMDRFYGGLGYRLIQSGDVDLDGWTGSFGLYF